MRSRSAQCLSPQNMVSAATQQMIALVCQVLVFTPFRQLRGKVQLPTHGDGGSRGCSKLGPWAARDFFAEVM